jgi:hypothetical protein
LHTRPGSCWRSTTPGEQGCERSSNRIARRDCTTSSGPIGEAQLFRNDVDIADFAEAYHAVTNADGRFSIALATLPIGEDVTFVDITGGDQGVHTVLATVLICAVREEGDTLLKDCADAALGDLTRPVTVDLQLGQP